MRGLRQEKTTKGRNPLSFGYAVGKDTLQRAGTRQQVFDFLKEEQ